MKALILAAGYGTRLYPKTKNFPKALLEINKKPVIEYIVEKLDTLKLSKIIVVTNDRFFNKFEQWRASLKTKTKIDIVNDLTKNPEDRLGAVGDMNVVFSNKKYQDDFIVLGGDNIFEQDLDGFLKAAKKIKVHPSIGIYDIKDKKEAVHFGVVSLNKEKLIVDFQEKPQYPKTTLVAMCLYYFPKKSLHFIRDYLNDENNTKDAAGAYINWVSKQDKVYGFEFKNFWVDIGSPQSYKKAQKLIKRRK